ncbi:MAG: hypothetical protein WBC44_13570 [Planctomycetaceae bacterium]
MTEFDMALDFLQTYVKAATEAAEQGESVDDGREFRDFCDDRGIEPSNQRKELIHDLAGVVKECITRGEDAEQYLIPAANLADGLEQHGWRRRFLDRDVDR